MLTSQLKTILLVFGLLVLYPNKNVPRQVTQARFIQTFPRNEVSGLYPSERFLPVTKTDSNSQEITKRDRFMTDDMKLKESSFGKRPVHSEHEEDVYVKKDTWDDEDPLNQYYDKNEKILPLNLKNNKRIKIVFEDPKEDSPSLKRTHYQETPKRDRFFTGERKLKDSSFGGGNPVNEKHKDVYYKKEGNAWEEDDDNVKEDKNNYLDLDPSNRFYDKYGKELPLNLKNYNRFRIVVENPEEDSPSVDSEETYFQETPKRDRFFPGGTKLKDSSSGHSEPLNRDYDMYEKELPLKLKDDNRIKIVFVDSKEDDSEQDNYQEATQRNRFLADYIKIKDASFGRQPVSSKHEDTYYEKESNSGAEDINLQEKTKMGRLDYDKYEKEPPLKMKYNSDRFLTEIAKLKDSSVGGNPLNDKQEDTYYVKESKTWDSPTDSPILTDSEKVNGVSQPVKSGASKQNNKTSIPESNITNLSNFGNDGSMKVSQQVEFFSKNETFPKHKFYLDVPHLEGNLTAENPNDTNLQGSSNNHSIDAVTPKGIVIEANERSNVNLTLKILSDVKPTEGTNQKQKKAAYYAEMDPNRDTENMMESRKKKSDEGIENGNATSSLIGSLPREVEKFKLLIPPSSPAETTSEVSQFQSFVEVRNRLQPEKAMSNVIYVGENKKEKEREAPEPCDSIACKIFTTKVVLIGILLVCAAIGTLVFFLLTNKNSSLNKYMNLIQGEPSDENEINSFPKRKKKPFGENDKEYSKPSEPLHSAKKSSSKPKIEMDHTGSNSSELKMLIENGTYTLEKHCKLNNKAKRSEESNKRSKYHSNGPSKYPTDEHETKRKETHQIPPQTAENRQESTKSIKEGKNGAHPKPLEESSMESSIVMTKDKKLKGRVMQWLLQDTVSDVEPEYPSLEQYKSELYCCPAKNSEGPKSSCEMVRLKREVHTIIDGLDLPSEDVPQQLTHRELQKRIMSTGDYEEIDDMLVSGKWGRSLLTGHGFHTIGHLKLTSQMSCVGPEVKKDINLEKIAKFGANNQMGTTVKTKSSHSTHVKDVVRDIKHRVEAGKPTSKTRSNRHL